MGKIYFGERELTNLCRTLIHIYHFKNQNKEPEAIVFPDVKEVGGVKVEFPKVEPKTKKKEEQDA